MRERVTWHFDQERRVTLRGVIVEAAMHALTRRTPLREGGEHVERIARVAVESWSERIGRWKVAEVECNGRRPRPTVRAGVYFGDRGHKVVVSGGAAEQFAYLTLRAPPGVTLPQGLAGREWSLYVDLNDRDTGLGPVIHYYCGGKRDEWRSSDPRWMHGVTHPKEWLLGRREHANEVVIAEHTVDLPLSDGVYPVQVKLTRHRWWHPRAPKLTEETTLYVDFDAPQGIPTGDYKRGGLYGWSERASTIAEGIARAVEHLTRERRENGWSAARERPVARRRLPLTDADITRPGEAVWEARDRFTGEWSVIGGEGDGDVTLLWTADEVRAMGCTIEEHGCGCCDAAYGEDCRPYRGGECPNLYLRPQASGEPRERPPEGTITPRETEGPR